MAVNVEMQRAERRGINLSPLGVAGLAALLVGAIAISTLIGRWTAPSPSIAHQGEVTAPGWVTDANAAGFTGRLGMTTEGEPFIPGVSDFPAASAGASDPFVPGVSDFPAFGPATGQFVQGVSDFPTFGSS